MDTRSKEIRRHIATRIRYRRDQLEQTQTDLARELTEYTGEEWSRGMVANLEIAKKGIPIEDLCAIASVQDRAVTWYFEDVPARLRDHIPGLLGRLLHAPGQLGHLTLGLAQSGSSGSAAA